MLLACELLNQTGDKVPVLITDMCTSGLSTLCFSQSIEPPDADNNFTRQELDPGVKVATTRVGLLYKGSSPHSTILTLGKWSSAIGSHNPLLGRVNPLELLDDFRLCDSLTFTCCKVSQYDDSFNF